LAGRPPLHRDAPGRLQIKVAVDELLGVATGIRLQPGARLTRRPGVARVFDELPIEFDAIGALAH
jgi:hypothetical protein